jgi:hypothetical protein
LKIIIIIISTICILALIILGYIIYGNNPVVADSGYLFYKNANFSIYKIYDRERGAIVYAIDGATSRGIFVLPDEEK